MHRLLSLVCLISLVVGCGKKNPVAEISVAESGVEIVDLGGQLDQDDWPAWRGPTGDGIISQRELPTEWSESSNIRWRSEIPGRGHSSPIVIADSVIVATALDDEQQQLVLAYDRTDGSEKWRKTIHEGGFPRRGQIHNKATNANGTLVFNGEALFTAFLNSEAIFATALDLEGNILWQKEIGKFVSKFGYAPSPVIYKSLVIFAADNSGGGYLTALDSKSGELAWKISRGNDSSYSSPAIANLGGKDQLLISGCRSVASYDPATGSENWITTATAESTCSTIVTSGDLLFASGGYPDKETVCLGVDGKRVWDNGTKVYEPSLVVAGEHLIAVNDDGVAYCWNKSSGEELWKKRLGGNFSASPVVCGDTVYVSNLAGSTFVFRTGDQIEIVSENRLGDDCYASPAVAGDQIFLRVGVGGGRDRQEQLVCIQSNSES